MWKTTAMDMTPKLARQVCSQVSQDAAYFRLRTRDGTLRSVVVPLDVIDRLALVEGVDLERPAPAETGLAI